jgi:hypothetical protein
MANAREFEAKSTVCLVPISKINLVYPSVLIGHDENYIVVHRSDPPRFEIISTSSLNLTRTIDAFDNCRSVQYKDGLIVSGSAQMGTHTRSHCIIRFFSPSNGKKQTFDAIYGLLKMCLNFIIAGYGTRKRVCACGKFKNLSPHDITI